ncbi:ABC transporter ATP-binding protein [Paenibacillus camelliae]|uniref:ABC transporter ATP-binding protein n=1 Tax=Paenibacillus camelliae TaxID=512410 RepID=UPI00203A576F|nr:ABC transporter ATP-binding protein [Paenibacillus camelliae]MCM3634485.1 ABC transporter ATP-binding protein/permease [Paenibacillus camelliae]
MAQAIRNWEMDQKSESNDPNTPKQKQKFSSSFRVLSVYMLEHKKTFIAFIICTLIAISGELLQPYLLKLAIDDHLMIGNTEYRSLLLIGCMYFGLSVTSLVFSFFQHNLLQKAGQSIIASIRKRLFEHISKLSMSYFDRVPSGSLITHVSSDTEAVNQFFHQVVLSIVRDGFTLIFILVMMFQLDVTLTLYSLILLPIIAAIAIAFRTYMRKTYQLARTRLSRLVAFTAENLSGMPLIQVFYQQREQSRQFNEKNESYFRANLREIRTNVIFNRTFEVLNNLAIACVVWFGGRAVLGDTLAFGVLYAFITYIRLFFQPINTITQQWNTLQAANVAIQRIWGILSIEPEVQDAKQPTKLPTPIRGEIEFRDVTFAYVDNEPVIKNLNLNIQSGQMIGVVGTTGAGKSSLISLLCRFYDIQQGNITIDGISIKELPQHDLHRTVGLVQQEPYLYTGSVLDNVRLFEPSISRETVIEACRFIGADLIIERMPEGYDTRLSEKGSGLSAGERQLISFARILVFQPRILILDEATANLDSQTEQLINRALDYVSKGRTTIVIAHRLSTIIGADRIIVMRKGEIVEQGTHQELIQINGIYKEMIDYTQGKGQPIVSY